MDTLLYLIANAFRIYLNFAFFSIYYDKKRVSYKYFVLYGTLFFAINSYIYLQFNLPILNILTTLLFFFGTCLLYQGSWQQYIFLPVGQFALNVMIETISVYIPMIDSNNLQQIHPGKSMILCDFIYLFVIILLKHCKREKTALPTKYWIALSSIPILSIIIQWVFTFNMTSSPLQVIISFSALFLINLLIFWLYNKLSEFIIKQNQIQLTEELNKAYLTQIQTFHESEQKITRIRHDIMNHINTLTNQLDNCYYEEAKQYIHSLNPEMLSIQNNHITGNIVIDSILNIYQQKANTKGIAFQIHTTIPVSNHFNEIDICSILSNLLNNALEAQDFTASQQEKYLAIEMISKNGLWLFQVSNSCNPKLYVKEGDLPKTNKKDSFLHGIGIQNIITAAEKYHGNVVFSAENGCFTSTVYLTEPISQ